MIKSIRSRLVQLFSQQFPMASLRIAMSFRDIGDPSMRGFRAMLLRTLTGKLQTLLRGIGFCQAVMVRPDGNVFVEADGILLSTSGTNRYFKLRSEYGNEGELMLAWLRNNGVEPSTILDVGANFGEISLYFSRVLPEAKIVAIEPSTSNLEILRLNMQTQLFPTENVKVIAKAVADKCTTLPMTRNLNAENQLVGNKPVPGSTDVENVECLTIDALLSECGFEHVDFCKIDIEGAEPLLKDALLANADRFGAFLIEFSRKAASEDYLSLLNGLMDAGFACCMREFSGMSQEQRFLTKEEATAKYLEFRNQWHDRLAVDFWFLRQGEA